VLTCSVARATCIADREVCENRLAAGRREQKEQTKALHQNLPRSAIEPGPTSMRSPADVRSDE
jgi:hypothetical protein